MPTRENNFAYLLVALIIFLLIMPVIDDFNLSHKAIARSVSFSMILLIGIWSLRHSPKAFRTGIGFVVTGIGFNLVALANDMEIFEYLAQAMVFLFLFMAALTALKQVMSHLRITANNIYGAICVYLLLGVNWAIIYSILNSISPAAFRGVTVPPGVIWDVEWIYFSFVTLTTLGYGDIVPVSSTARAFAYCEAIFGVFYLAILVAGLVGVFIADRINKRA